MANGQTINWGEHWQLWTRESIWKKLHNKITYCILHYMIGAMGEHAHKTWVWRECSLPKKNNLLNTSFKCATGALDFHLYNWKWRFMRLQRLDGLHLKMEFQVEVRWGGGKKGTIVVTAVLPSSRSCKDKRTMWKKCEDILWQLGASFQLAQLPARAHMELWRIRCPGRYVATILHYFQFLPTHIAFVCYCLQPIAFVCWITL